MVAVSVGILQRKDQFLIGLRKRDDKQNPNVWDFPGGRVEKGETYQEALTREIKEEIGVELIDPNWILVWEGFHPDFNNIFITFWRIRVWEGHPFPIEYQELLWLTKEQILAKDDLINDLMKHILMIL